MQPWLGFTAIDISNLPLDTYEFNYDSSLVVKEVIMINPWQILYLGVNLKFVRLSGKVFFFLLRLRT
jgi:hypothetical protein